MRKDRLPEGVTSIGYSAFEECSGLTSVTIPEGVRCIYYTTFFSCVNLMSVTIPGSVTSIGERAFDYCDSMTIHAPVKSHAARYAKRKKLPFEAIDME